MNHPTPRIPDNSVWRPVPKRLLRPFVRSSISDDAGRRHTILWPRIFAAFFGLVLVAYLSIACAAFWFVRYHQHIQTIGLLDLMLPSRWSHNGMARGDHLIITAAKLADEGKHAESLVLVRNGLAQSPANRDGRLLLAKLLLRAQRPDTARQILLDGLSFHRNDPIYLHPLLLFLLEQQQDARVIALARASLQTTPPATECNRLLAFAAATASYDRGAYDQADDFLRALPLLGFSRDGRLLSAKIEWERGYRDLALFQLHALVTEFPNDIELHTSLAAYLADRGLDDEARRLSLSFQIAHPTLPSPRIELLHAYHRAGDRDHVAREAGALLRDFATNSTALLALASFAADTGDVALARRVDDHAVARRLPRDTFAILVVEALVVAHDYQAALDGIHQLLQENPSWDVRYAALFSSLQAIAHFGRGDVDAARLYLANFLNQPNLRAENLLALAQRLADIDAGEQARQTLLRAVAADPLNQAALTRLVELDLNLNRIDELPAHLQRLLTMRKPSPDVLRVAQHKLGSDLFLFSTERPAALDAVRVALERVPTVTL